MLLVFFIVLILLVVLIIISTMGVAVTGSRNVKSLYGSLSLVALCCRCFYGAERISDAVVPY